MASVVVAIGVVEGAGVDTLGNSLCKKFPLILLIRHVAGCLFEVIKIKKLT